MPYHGYVVPAAAHDRLYAHLKTRIPQHITVLPILGQDSLTALLYMERKEVENLADIPSLATLELQMDTLTYLFTSLYKIKKEDVIVRLQK